MQTTTKMCPIHNIRLARLFELAYHNDGRKEVVRQINVRYHCRVCRAAEELKKVSSKIHKS